MLKVNPNERLSSSQALRHPWFIYHRNRKLQRERMFVQVSDLKAMAIYGKTPVLKKITLMFLAVRLNQKSMADIIRKFLEADKDENGIICKEEFNLIFQQATGQPIPYQATNILFEMIDTNVNGLIEFSELKASMLKTTIFLQQDNLRKTFSFFDKDKSGYITIDELNLSL